MPLRRLWFVLGISQVFLFAHLSDASSVFWGVLGGVGNYGFSSAGQSTVVDSPGALKVLLGVSLSRQMEVSFEHSRSLGFSGGITTGMGATEFVLRYYPFFESPSFESESLIPGGARYKAVGFSSWMALGAGFAQGSSTNVSMLGLSVTPALGIDWHWGGAQFMRVQASVTSASGTGSLLGSAIHFGLCQFLH